MSYSTEKFIKLAALKELAERIKAEVTNLSSKIDGMATVGGEPNMIEKIKVNGSVQPINGADKSVNIAVPTKVSDLTNNSNFQSATEVASAIQAAISESGHAVFRKVDSVPTVGNAQANVLYLVHNSTTNHYDIYALVGESVELLDDTTVDLTAYSTTEQIQTLLNGYVQKNGSKQLSTEDYTTDEKNKLAGLSNYTHPTSVAGAKTSGLYKITTDANGHITAAAAVAKADITKLGIPDTTVVSESKNGLMSSDDKQKLDGLEFATNEEVTEMLDEVFAED